MKYRIEFWKYDIFDYDEAADHLNAMAQQGFELIAADQYLALYKVNPAMPEQKYAVDLLPQGEEREAFLALCEDAGWKRVTRCSQEFGIFVASKKATPIYTDPLTRYQNAGRAIKGSTRSISSILLNLNLFCIIAYFYYDACKDGFMQFPGSLLYGGVILIGFFTTITAMINTIHIHRCVIAAREGRVRSKPTWIRAVCKINRYYNLWVIVAVFLWDMIAMTESGEAPWKFAILATAPLFFCLDFLASAFQGEGKIYDKIFCGCGLAIIFYSLYIFVHVITGR